MNDFESLLNYYKNELKWNPPFAEVFSRWIRRIFSNA